MTLQTKCKEYLVLFFKCDAYIELTVNLNLLGGGGGGRRATSTVHIRQQLLKFLTNSKDHSIHFTNKVEFILCQNELIYSRAQ